MFFNIIGSVFVLASQFGSAIIIIVSLTAIAYLTVISVSRKRKLELRTECIDRSDIKSAIKNESISNVELLKYFCMEPYEVGRYSKALLREQKADWEYSIYTHMTLLLEEAIRVSGE